MNRQHQRTWTLGGIFYLVGLLIVLFVAGLRVHETYQVYAADGQADLDVALAEPMAMALSPTARPLVQPTVPPVSVLLATPTPEASQRALPNLNPEGSGDLTAEVPVEPVDVPSTITRIVVPSITLDKKVVEVGWIAQQQGGRQVAVYDVEKYRVGHHQGSSNPGGGSNIVLAGHSGGRAYPFNDIYYLKHGDLVELWSNGEVFNYAVSEHIVVDEEGEPIEKRVANARYILPTEHETVTMIACWPLTGKDKFKQRVIIQAIPVRVPSPTTIETSGWMPR